MRCRLELELYDNGCVAAVAAGQSKQSQRLHSGFWCGILQLALPQFASPSPTRPKASTLPLKEEDLFGAAVKQVPASALCPLCYHTPALLKSVRSSPPLHLPLAPGGWWEFSVGPGAELGSIALEPVPFAVKVSIGSH